jgi:hypothetical protein
MHRTHRSQTAPPALAAALLLCASCSAPQEETTGSAPAAHTVEDAVRQRQQQIDPPAVLRETPPQRRRVTYQRFFTVDYDAAEVLADAEVVLRQGPLELLACAPLTKEHESILRILGRPLHLYEALGLLGLEPGSPPGWDREKRERIPPCGEALDILIRYDSNGRLCEVCSWDWMVALGSKEPVPPRPWLFMGSFFCENGRFAADYDGVVVSVVDFGTEVVGLAKYHSADNQHLWLGPNTEAIPPLGTRCTLVFRRPSHDSAMDDE